MASFRFTPAFVLALAVGLTLGALPATAAGCPGWDGSCPSNMGQHLLQASKRNSMLETLHGEATSEIAQKVFQGLHVDLSELEEYVDSLGASAAGHNYTMSDTEKSALETIAQLVRQMQNATDTQHSEDQAEIYRMNYLIGNCSSDANISLSRVAVLNSSVQTYRRAHASCRSSEGVANDSMTTTCSDYDSHRKNNAPPSCSPTELSIDYLQAGDGTKKTQMEACLKALDSWLSPFYTKYNSCKSEMKLHNNRSAECDSKQQNFEQAFCLYESRLEGACDVQETCIAKTTAARDSAQAKVKLSEAARKDDFAAGKRLLCLLDVLMSNNTQKVQTLARCRASTAQTSKYDIVYPDTTKPTSCVKEKSEPCDSSWVAREYETQTWYDKAHTKACTPCQAPTTTTTTTQATTAQLWTKRTVTCIATDQGGWNRDNGKRVFGTPAQCMASCDGDASCKGLAYRTQDSACFYFTQQCGAGEAMPPNTVCSTDWCNYDLQP